MLSERTGECAKIPTLLQTAKSAGLGIGNNIVKMKNEYNQAMALTEKTKGHFDNVKFGTTQIKKSKGIGRGNLIPKKLHDTSMENERILLAIEQAQHTSNQICNTLVLLGEEASPVIRIKNWLGYSLFAMEKWIDTRQKLYMQRGRTVDETEVKANEIVRLTRGLASAYELWRRMELLNPETATIFLNEAYAHIDLLQKENNLEYLTYDLNLTRAKKLGNFLYDLMQNFDNEKHIKSFLKTFDRAAKLFAMTTLSARKTA